MDDTARERFFRRAAMLTDAVLRSPDKPWESPVRDPRRRVRKQQQHSTPRTGESRRTNAPGSGSPPRHQEQQEEEDQQVEEEEEEEEGGGGGGGMDVDQVGPLTLSMASAGPELMAWDAPPVFGALSPVAAPSDEEEDDWNHGAHDQASNPLVLSVSLHDDANSNSNTSSHSPPTLDVLSRGPLAKLPLRVLGRDAGTLVMAAVPAAMIPHEWQGFYHALLAREVLLAANGPQTRGSAKPNTRAKTRRTRASTSTNTRTTRIDRLGRIACGAALRRAMDQLLRGVLAEDEGLPQPMAGMLGGLSLAHLCAASPAARRISACFGSVPWRCAMDKGSANGHPPLGEEEEDTDAVCMVGRACARAGLVRGVVLQEALAVFLPAVASILPAWCRSHLCGALRRGEPMAEALDVLVSVESTHGTARRGPADAAGLLMAGLRRRTKAWHRRANKQQQQQHQQQEEEEEEGQQDGGIRLWHGVRVEEAVRSEALPAGGMRVVAAVEIGGRAVLADIKLFPADTMYYPHLFYTGPAVLVHALHQENPDAMLACPLQWPASPTAGAEDAWQWSREGEAAWWCRWWPQVPYIPPHMRWTLLADMSLPNRTSIGGVEQ